MLVDLHAPATPNEAGLNKVVAAIQPTDRRIYGALVTFSLLRPLELLDRE